MTRSSVHDDLDGYDDHNDRDTPLAPFFESCFVQPFASQDLDEMNIEIIRNTLYKVILAFLILGQQWKAPSKCPSSNPQAFYQLFFCSPTLSRSTTSA